jgi:hypothetical protein
MLPKPRAASAERGSVCGAARQTVDNTKIKKKKSREGMYGAVGATWLGRDIRLVDNVHRRWAMRLAAPFTGPLGSPSPTA